PTVGRVGSTSMWTSPAKESTSTASCCSTGRRSMTSCCLVRPPQPTDAAAAKAARRVATRAEGRPPAELPSAFAFMRLPSVRGRLYQGLGRSRRAGPLIEAATALGGRARLIINYDDDPLRPRTNDFIGSAAPDGDRERNAGF